jgi:hypothetical protein
MGSLIACGCLGEHCIGGCLAAIGSTISIVTVGNEFAQLLDVPATDFDADLYPSAVIIGIFTQLRGKLLAEAKLTFGEGRFPTGNFEMIHYRLIVLPFGSDGPWRNGHWMGLAN